MTPGVVYARYKQGALIGKLNGDRQYQIDFSKATMKMGTFHSLEVTRTPVDDATKEEANVQDKQLSKFARRINVKKINFQIS